MSADKKIQPIIKKIIKKGHGGHHGGSWKVAYADFVTAMMAFFLVMWLLAISSEQGKAALAEYFDGLTLTDAIFNGGTPSAFDSNNSPGILLQGGCFELNQKGQELEQRAAALDEREKALADRRDERPNMGATLPTDRPQNPDLTDLPAGEEGGEGSTETGIAPGDGATLVTPGMGEGTSAEAKAAKGQFISDLAGAVTASLSGAGLGPSDLRGQFMVENVAGGIKIQIMDKEGQPMFLSGQPRLTPLAMVILGTVAERLKTIPNKLSIEGHTDSVQTISQELTNWELSTARASAARRFLSRNGVTDDRLTMVAGYAATQPLSGTNPTDPVNRRIALMIWDQPVKAEPAPSPPASSTPAAPNGPTGSASPAEPASQPPAAGDVSPASPPARNNVRTTGPRVFPERPTQEALEQMLLEDTLHKASIPDTSTAGPPASSE
ncbi:MAG: OmpA family protein [Deltaproteobacteria bacterium]|jgi:chemotaxis protein MotB|nr:OmpA family protein [Deltaproteobacteria bacterium]